MKKEIIIQIKKLGLFDQISEESMDMLIRHSIIQLYPKGQYIFQDKDFLDSVYICISGKISVYKLSENGQKRIIFILDNGQILNDNLTGTIPACISCVAFEESLMLKCSIHQFEKLLKQDYTLMKNVFEQYTSKLRRTYRQLKNAPTNVSIEKKLAAKLYKLGRDYGIEAEDGVRVELSLSVMYLSQLLGAQRETVSRAIKKLTDLELIMYDNKTVTIVNLNELGTYFKSQK